MVRKALTAVFVAALLAVPAASAGGNPHDQQSPSPSIATVVVAPHVVKPADLPQSGGATAGSPAGAAGVSAADCGACITTCWVSTTRSGPSDWSGHVFLYHDLYWCGNGAVVTYAWVNQRYDQSGWYAMTFHDGAYFSAGCAGSCSSTTASGYILWSWSAPTGWFNSNGSSHLNTTVYAWGAIST